MSLKPRSKVKQAGICDGVPSTEVYRKQNALRRDCIYNIEIVLEIGVSGISNILLIIF